MARRYSAELNLTPFIALFALLVGALLLTGVWGQLGALVSSPAPVLDANSSESQEERVQLSVTVFDNELKMFEGQGQIDVPDIDKKINKDLLLKELRRWRQFHPERKEVVLYTGNRTPYHRMLAVLDILIGEGWSDVGVSAQQ